MTKAEFEQRMKKLSSLVGDENTMEDFNDCYAEILAEISAAGPVPRRYEMAARCGAWLTTSYNF